MARQIIIQGGEILNLDGSFTQGGVAIRIEGFKSNPGCPDEGQIWIETFEGKTKVHIWNGEQEDPVTVELHPDETRDIPS